jgi:hypothetical protein
MDNEVYKSNPLSHTAYDSWFSPARTLEKSGGMTPVNSSANIPKDSPGRFLVLPVLVVFLWGAGTAEAQTPTPSAGSRDSASQKTLPDWLEAGVELRWRGEFRDNADFSSPDDFDFFLGQRVRLHLLIRAHSQLSFYVQAQDVWLFGAERDKIIHNLATNLHQAYFDWAPGGSQRWGLRAGRQEFLYGRQRLVGGFNWDNVGRSFDGARLRYKRAAWTGDFLWGRLVEVRRRGTPHRPGNRDLYGVHVSHAAKDTARRTELYGFALHDGLRTGGELGGTLQPTDVVTLGFRHQRAPTTGWRYEVENAWQFGDRGPDDHSAVAFVGSAGYGWGRRFRPVVNFEYAFATGDNDPTDGNSDEFNNLFPTNHLHYGYADLVGLRNLHDFRATFSSRLHPRLSLQADYHRLLLAEKRGPWKNAGGAVLGFDPTGQSGRDLGQELDLTARIPILERHLNLMAGYSFFSPGGFVKRTRGSENHHFGYIQTIVRF